MRTAAQRTGDDAESMVARHLEQLGWRVLGRRLRIGRAELDIVAMDPRPPAALVVVEVRWRSRRDFGLPEETIGHRKRALLHRAGFALREAGALPDGTPLAPVPLRFDLIVVEPGRPPRHYRHAL